eukprot:2669084-Ditylum_brightwellii.AAC.1
MVLKKDQTISDKNIVLCRYIEREKKQNLYKLLDGQYKEINKRYDLLQSDASFDLRSYGVVLYQTLARKSLFASDASDNLVGAPKLQRLHDWSTVDVEVA